jgi:hypothetical protein
MVIIDLTAIFIIHGTILGEDMISLPTMDLLTPAHISLITVDVDMAVEEEVVVVEEEVEEVVVAVEEAVVAVEENRVCSLIDIVVYIN